MPVSAGAVWRPLGIRAAVVLLVSSVACERQPAEPTLSVSQSQPSVLGVARARLIEPGDHPGTIPPIVAAWSSAGVDDPINLAFDAAANRAWALEPSTRQLLEMPAGPDGSVDRLTARRIDARGFGLRDPQGLTVDPASGRLFVLDAGPRIVRLEPHPQRGFQSPLVSVVDLAPAGLARVRGIALDPTTGHFHLLDPSAQTLHELSPEGRLVATRDVSGFGLDAPRGMSFAPSGDATDDPSAVGLYVAAGAYVTELSLAEPVAVIAAATTATLVRTVETSAYSPPSPDPSGIAFASHAGRLVIVDGEVDEMTIYAGANAFETTLAGSLSRAWTTVGFSNEPTGAAYNPANRHLFLTDDNGTRVFEIDPGPDGLYRTADDRVTSFETEPFGNTDPEGIAFDAASGALFIADGVNSEVFRVMPGANGVFDGVSPAGDDQVTGFDTRVHGLGDPEGIAFDSDLGQVYVVGFPEELVFQFSPTGALLGTIDIASAQAHKPAGLEYVPASAHAGTRALYVVDRGIDNDGNPTENDGKLYEFTLPSISGNAPPGVTITAPPDGSTFTQGTAVTFTGTATDAESGNLTASLTWSSSRDGALGSGGSITTSTLSQGTHTITAAVTDGDGAQGSASIAVTVNAPGSGTVVQLRVAASSDDAEESATGSMSLASSDLELVFSGSNQTVGLRFAGVALPPGATITAASVQFQVDETTSGATALAIGGQAADDAAAFTTTSGNISSRARTASTVAWSPAAWSTAGEAGAAQRTPDLAAIVQEIVSRPGWRSGNALVLIVTGTGERVAEAYDGLPAAAPLLRVEYATGPNTAPAATNVSISGTPQVGRVLTGNYSYADAEGDPEGTSTYRWLRNGVPIGGAAARSYTLVDADQGASIAFEVTPVAATGASPGAAVQSPAVGPVAAPVPNSVPVASNVTISGTARVGQTLTGNYTYGDADGDAEGTSTYRWLRDGTSISGATARSHTLVTADQGTSIVFEVTPVAAAGASPGAAVQSPAVGPVAAPPTVVQVRVAASSDDAEESATGAMDLVSSDLELALVRSSQTVGLRFAGVALPPGATITAASVQFQVGRKASRATALTIGGQAADDAAAFTTTSGNISSRSRTASTVAWSPASWPTVGQAGAAQRTPDLAAIVQEIVSRPGWQSGNALVLIVTGTGERVAEAYDGLPAAAALLRIEYVTGSTPP